MKTGSGLDRFCRLLVLTMGFTVLCFPMCAWGKEGKIAVDEYSVHDILSRGGYPQQDIVTDAGVQPVEVKKRKNQIIISAPSKLTQSDTEYILSEDVSADGTAFTIEASSVTLNLNGHKITYLQKASSEPAYGILIPGYHRKDIFICNGTIIQGEGASSAMSSHPINDYDASHIDIGGVEIIYSTPDTSGIFLLWVNDAKIHYVTIKDKGNIVTNRHQGVAAIEANRGGRASRHIIHHSLIQGTRQIGIRAGTDSEVYKNEIHIDSSVTNSTGISASGRIHHNRIIGEGVHPIGIWPGSDVKVHDNFVEVQNTRRGEEYGDTGASCLRMTWGNDNVEVVHNTFILRATENYRGSGVRSWGRALWVGLPKPEQSAEFHDNFIMAVNDDGEAKAAAIAVVCNNESPNLVFRNNVIVSNWANVLLSDSYGHAGGYPRFVDNEFVKVDSYRNYNTILSQYSYRPSTGVFIANTFRNGASQKAVNLEYGGSGLKEIAVGWHLYLTVINTAGQPVKDATIIVQDSNGKQVFSGVTDEMGKRHAEIIVYELTNCKGGSTSKEIDKVKGKKIDLTPHRVIVSKDDRKAESVVNLNGNMNVTITL